MGFMYFYKHAYQDKQNVASQKEDLVCLSIFFSKIKWQIYEKQYPKVYQEGFVIYEFTTLINDIQNSPLLILS